MTAAVFRAATGLGDVRGGPSSASGNNGAASRTGFFGFSTLGQRLLKHARLSRCLQASIGFVGWEA